MQGNETRERWSKLWLIPRQGGYAHPMVYRHPVRNETALLFHCGEQFCQGWAVDDDHVDRAQRRATGSLPADVVQAELRSVMDLAVDKIGVKIQWEAGDFAIN